MDDTHVISAKISASPGNAEQITDCFNHFAGASFGVALFRSFYDSDTVQPSPLLVWSMVSRILIDSQDADGVLRTQERQIDEFVGPIAALGEDAAGVLRADLRQILGHSWSAWLPFLLFSPKPHCRSIWESWTVHFPPLTPEEVAMRAILFGLLADEGYRLLYSARGLEAKFADAGPADSAVIRLGRLIREYLKSERREDIKVIFERWRKSLYPLIPKLQQAQRVTRGFAPEDPMFENLVLAILAVAEWRIQPELWRIHDYIKSCLEHPDERLTTDQLVLSGALFGMLEGYRHLGSGLSDRAWRRHLARYALALALQYEEKTAAGIPRFYLGETGELQLETPLLHLQRAHRETIRTLEYLPEGASLIAQDTLCLDLKLSDIPLVYQLALSSG